MIFWHLCSCQDEEGIGQDLT